MPDDTPTHPTPATHPNRGVLARAHRFLIYLGALYVALVVLVTFPPVQRHLVYMHALRFPFFADFDMPEKYGLAPFQTANVYIPTADNETLGAWFTLADAFHAARPRAPTAPPDDAAILAALAAHPTVLFFHGTAATRAFHRRVRHYEAFAARLGANVLALDYRGFGDSSGVPSEAGLARDARAAWEWLVGRGGARARDVLVVGNSLGTAVAAGLVRELELEQEGAPASRGLVLLAPFTSVEALLDTYAVLGLVPLLAPLKSLPYVPVLYKRLLRHRFDTLSKVAGLHTPVLLVHAQDDWDIPHAHSAALFAAMLEPHLPALPPAAAAAGAASDAVEASAAAYRARAEARAALVVRTEVPRLGVTEAFARGGSDVVYLETRWGGHDTVGLLGGVLEVMRARYDLGRSVCD